MAEVKRVQPSTPMNQQVPEQLPSSHRNFLAHPQPVTPSIPRLASSMRWSLTSSMQGTLELRGTLTLSSRQSGMQALVGLRRLARKTF